MGSPAPARAAGPRVPAARGGFQGQGFRGGFAGPRGFRGGYWGGAPYFFGGAFLGLALGAAFADSWYDEYPAYYGYYAPYGVAPPPPYDDPWAYNYGPPPPAGRSGAAAAGLRLLAVGRGPLQV